jgi:hypothetical protein
MEAWILYCNNYALEGNHGRAYGVVRMKAQAMEWCSFGDYFHVTPTTLFGDHKDLNELVVEIKE